MEWRRDRHPARLRRSRAGEALAASIISPVDYWPELPPVRELPAGYRLWAWWLRNGPRRRQGTVGGNALFRLLRRTSAVVRPHRDPYVTLHAPPRPALTIHLDDFESFHHALPVWYRGDVETTIVLRLLENGQSYIDAGANFGVYALHAASRARDSRICAIEPQPHLVAAIQRSARANGFDNLLAIEAAVAQENGSIDLLVGTGGSGSASIHTERAEPSARHLRVRTMTLDTIVAAHGLTPVSVLKMDIENAEALALQGARELLARDAPFVIFEAGALQPQDEVFAILRGAGYHSFYDETSVTEQELVAPRLDRTLTNIVAVPHGRDAGRILIDR